MPYNRQSIMVNWIFSVTGTDEVAYTGVHFSGASDFDASAGLSQLVDAGLEGLSGPMITLMGSSDLLWANFSNLVSVKAAALGVSGEYLGAPAILDGLTGNTGTATGPVYPQDSVVLSLRTNTTFGEANYGRMYLPHCAINRATTTPFMSGTNLAPFATACQTFLNALNDYMNTGDDPSALTIMSAKGTGTSKAVTNMAVGNVLDTQVRRRRQLNENYTFKTVSL
jgi:hypothetical protein